VTFPGNGYFLVQTGIGAIQLASTTVGHSLIQKVLQKSKQALSGHTLIYMTGYFVHPQIIPTKVKLDDCISSMVGEEKELFLSFIRRMLQWAPEDRGTAKELRDDPWLRSGLD